MTNKLDKDYLALCQDILDKGTKKETRNGGTISVFGRQIRHSMKDGFPLLTTKKMAFKTMVTELLWFLRGDTCIKFLVDNGCHIWDGDAYKNWCRQFDVDPNNFDAEELVKGHGDQCWGYPILDHVKPTSKEYKRGQINAYLEGKADKPFFYLTQEEFINKIKTDDEFAKKWGSLGKIYGKQWRDWESRPNIKSWKNEKRETIDDLGQHYYYETKSYDQIANLINDLKTNPDSRRLMVSAWNVGELDQMVLPPCHYGFQVYTRELSLEERRKLAKYDSEFVSPMTIESWDRNNVPTRAISLMWNQRSVDVPLGLPFNIASYGLLLEIIAKIVNMVPDELIGNLGDCHIYTNQIDGIKEQIGKKYTLSERMELWEQLPNKDVMDFPIGPLTNSRYHDILNSIGVPKTTRDAFPLPQLNINTEFWPTENGSCGEGPIDAQAVLKSFSNNDFCKCLMEEDIQLVNYQSHPSIKMPLSN
jgi:thymidylate synthase